MSVFYIRSFEIFTPTRATDIPGGGQNFMLHDFFS